MKEFMKKNINAFLESFKKLDVRLLYSILYDVIGYVLIGGCIKVYQTVLYKLLYKLPDISSLQSIDPSNPQIAQVLASLKIVFSQLAIYTLLLGAAVFLIWVFFKGIIWSAVLKKSVDFKFYRKFLLVNLLWGLIWFFVLILSFIFVKQNVLAYLAIIFFMLLIYLTCILYYNSVKEKKIKRIFNETFRIGLKRIYYFIIPAVVMFLVFFILMQSYWFFIRLSDVVQAVIFIIIGIVFVAWTRFYVSNIVEIASK